MRRLTVVAIFIALYLAAPALEAASGIPALTVSPGKGGAQNYSLTLQIVALMTGITLLPAALLMLTSFTRIIIVLSILRQAIGLMQAPPTHVLIGISIFLTIFIMGPVFDKIYADAVNPYIAEKIEFNDAISKAREPLRKFMLDQVRESDIETFGKIAGVGDIDGPEKVPFSILMPAFATSELKTAFQIGFLIYIPFLVIDLVVASVLMAMGMMMLSPMMISLPFKIMLFVLVDGWTLVMGTLASSFYL